MALGLGSEHLVWWLQWVALVSPYFIAFHAILHSQPGESAPPYGPWEHVPPHVWTNQSNWATTQDEAEDEEEVGVLCCHKRSTVTVCDECKEHYYYCTKCIDTHTFGTNVVC